MKFLRALLAVMLVALAMVIAPDAASAHSGHTQPPEAGIYCNTSLGAKNLQFQGSLANYGQRIWRSCTYSGAASYLSEYRGNGTLYRPSVGTYYRTSLSTLLSGGPQTIRPTDWTMDQLVVTQNGAGKLRFSQVIQTHCCGDAAREFKVVAGAEWHWDDAATLASTGAVTGTRPSADTVTIGDLAPPYPSHWFDGADPAPVPTVATPQIVCSRALTSGGGQDFVRLSNRTLNPQAGATDVVELRLSWESVWRSGTSTSEIQLPAISSMPPTGWRGMCRVTRTLTDVDIGVNPTSATGPASHQALALNEIQDLATVGSGVNYELWEQNANEAFVAPGTGVLSPWLTLGTGAASAVATSPITKIPGYGWGIAGLAGVAAASMWVADDMTSSYENGCGLFDALKGLFGADCPQPEQLESPVALRSQVKLLSPTLDPLTKQQLTAGAKWKTAVAVAEVLIDPRRREAGSRTVTAVQPPPTMTPTQISQFSGYVPSTDPDGGGGTDGNCDFGGFKVLKILNPFNMLNTIKCALRWAFVPPDSSWASVLDRASTVPPFSALVEVDQTRVVLAGMVDTATNGTGCWNADFSGSTPGGSTPSLNVWLPTPSESGCPGINGGVRTAWDNEAGDVYGWRSTIRLGLLLLLYLVATLKVVAVLVPQGGNASALEPGS